MCLAARGGNKYNDSNKEEVMTANELIRKLLMIPKESLEKEVVIQGNGTITSICVNPENTVISGE